MEKQNTSAVERKKIILLNRVSSVLEPLIIRITEWGYDTQSVLDSTAVKSTVASALKEVAILDLSPEIDLDTLSAHIKNLKTRVPHLSVLGIFTGKMKFSWHQAYQLGLEGIFQFPLEEDNFLNRVFELCPQTLDVKKVGVDALVKVNITSIDRNEALPFDVFVYLPANQRVVLLRKGGNLLEPQVQERFKQNQKWTLYIRRSDLNAFQADLGKSIFNESGAGSEVKAHLQQALHGFFSETEYSEQESEQVLHNLKAALDKQMLSNSSTREKWQTANAIVSEKLTYLSHSQNVASYCATFGRALGFEPMSDLALAGLLHDVGLGELPPELLWKTHAMMSEDERAQYRLHPGFAKNTLQKLTKGNEKVIEAILYHHERLDGSGYPYGLKADKLPLMAKILALSDEFDKLTSLRPGFPQLTPREAIIKLAGLEGNPTDPVFDTDLFKPILDLFYEPPKPLVKETPAPVRGQTLQDWISRATPSSGTPILASTEAINKVRLQLREHFQSTKGKPKNAHARI